MKWAFVHARCSYDGPHLDLQRQAATVWWQGKGGLRWCHVCRTIRTLLTFEDAPDLLVLHVGGNDLGLVKLGDLRHSISHILGQLRLLLPSTRFIYSQILPRLVWRNETKHFAIEQARKRINSFVASYILRTGGGYIRYPDICEQTSFFRVDGTHLSVLGNELFLYRLQQGLQAFLCSKISVSPSAGEDGPWLAD